MKKHEIINEAIQLLKESGTALISYIGEDEFPKSRWMVPVILSTEGGLIYSITAPDFPKTEALIKNPNTEWCFQNRQLTKIITFQGKTNVVDTPSLKADIIERIGNKLKPFWKQRGDILDYIVLETVIDEGVFLLPMTAEREVVDFTKGA